MISLCAPALIYVAFSVTQIIIDTFKGLYNTAFFKFIVMIVITILLNALCQSGMTLVSWLIVFIPFIFMSIIVVILLYVFGLDAATGNLDYTHDECLDDKHKNIKEKRQEVKEEVVEEVNDPNVYKRPPVTTSDPQIV